MLTPRRVPKRWPLCGHLLIKEKRELEEEGKKYASIISSIVELENLDST